MPSALAQGVHLPLIAPVNRLYVCIWRLHISLNAPFPFECHSISRMTSIYSERPWQYPEPIRNGAIFLRILRIPASEPGHSQTALMTFNLRLMQWERHADIEFDPSFAGKWRTDKNRSQWHLTIANPHENIGSDSFRFSVNWTTGRKSHEWH